MIVHLCFKFFIIYINSNILQVETRSSDVVILDQTNLPEFVLEELETNSSSDEPATSHATVITDTFREAAKCRVYMAQSTIPGAGMGIFAGKDFNEGDEVTTGDGVVPVINMHWNNNVEEFENDFLWGRLLVCLNE